MSWLCKVIVETGCLLICAQALVHFGPNASYERFLRLLVGSMVLVQLCSPFFTFFSDDGMNLMQRLEKVTAQIEEDVAAAQQEASLIQEKLSAMTLTEVQERIQERVAQEAQEQENQEREDQKQEDQEQGMQGQAIQDQAAQDVDSGGEASASDKIKVDVEKTEIILEQIKVGGEADDE